MFDYSYSDNIRYSSTGRLIKPPDKFQANVKMPAKQKQNTEMNPVTISSGKTDAR